jgi:diguanylate cyclase (GGDEF)-like protein
VVWTLAATLTVGGFAIANEVGWRLPIEVTPGGLRFLHFSGLAGLMLCVYLLVSVLKRMEFGARQALHAANARLERQALTDALTGIPNRHRFDQVLEEEWARHERAGLPLSIALVDADFFKAFNDEYGHLVGDECLRMVAKVIQSSVRRPGDFCARFGGEEFVIVLPNTDEAGAVRTAEMIRDRMRELRIAHARSAVGPHVTVSIGISTTIPTRDASYQDLLNDADMAMYRAKASGRDRIVLAAAAAAV